MTPRVTAMLKCLWISRDLPFPLDAGDKVYSARLARALAEAGVRVRFLGSGRTGDAPSDWPVEWRPVRHRKRHPVATLFSTLPSVAAVHATPTYRRTLRAELVDSWDCIVLDGYGSGWALRECQNILRARGDDTTALVYVSHNHEEQLWRSMARTARGALPRRIALWQNYLKVRALERTLVRNATLVSAITDEDARAYSVYAPQVPKVVLTPGYSGEVAAPRSIGPETPRRVALVGSFRWTVKQENLRRFIACADAVFAAQGIHLDVVGDVPAELRRALGTLAATTFHGYVDRPADILRNARIAVVPELIGGGFKLKLLDYIFGRVPVATLGAAAAGLPPPAKDALLCRDDLPELVRGICEVIDDLPRLNHMQSAALAGAAAHFDWAARGQAFAAAIERCRTIGAGNAAPLAEVFDG